MICPLCGKETKQAHRLRRDVDSVRLYHCECGEELVTVEDKPKCECGSFGLCNHTDRIDKAKVRYKLCRVCGKRWVSYESIQLYIHVRSGLVVASTEMGA